MRYNTRPQLKKYFLEVENEEGMYVCQECLEDPILRKLQPMLIADKTCAACGNLTRKALGSKRIARFIRDYLPRHFTVDIGLHPGYEMTLGKVVSEAIRCRSQGVYEAIAEHLLDPRADGEEFYSPGQEYCKRPSPFSSKSEEHLHVVSDWEDIAHELTHGRRFFNDKAREFFESLVAEAIGAKSAEAPEKSAVITTLPAGTFVYRARIANDAREAVKFAEDPTNELGAPPKTRAANNRMSPAGISLLYVANDVTTSIAEVRPFIGDAVVVGQFTTSAPLTLFDFTALDNRLDHSALSLFNPGFQMRADRRRLMEYLHDEIARPSRAQDTDYVVTQALAEFIRYYEPQAFDGIMFRSVQHDGGVNFVLFDKGRPESMQAPDWRPKFALHISSDAARIHHVCSVRYKTDEAWP